MKVFISWSGERSQALALALHEWSQLVLHYIKPWISKSDIDAGERWANEVAKELEATNFGIICITRENVNSAWILFEAGALAKSMQEGRMIPLLLDIDFKDITGPLAQFQAKRVDKSGLADIINSINRFSAEPIPQPRLSQLFEITWPQFEQKVSEIPKPTSPVKQTRPQQEILEELVSSIRGLDVRFRDSFDDSPRWRHRRSRFHPMMFEEMSHALKLKRGNPLMLLIWSSFLRDDFPWIYDLARIAYEAAAGGKSHKSEQSYHRFVTAVRSLRRGPFLRELGGDDVTHMLIHEMEHFLDYNADEAVASGAIEVAKEESTEDDPSN